MDRNSASGNDKGDKNAWSKKEEDEEDEEDEDAEIMNIRRSTAKSQARNGSSTNHNQGNTATTKNASEDQESMKSSSSDEDPENFRVDHGSAGDDDYKAPESSSSSSSDQNQDEDDDDDDDDISRGQRRSSSFRLASRARLKPGEIPEEFLRRSSRSKQPVSRFRESSATSSGLDLPKDDEDYLDEVEEEEEEKDDESDSDFRDGDEDEPRNKKRKKQSAPVASKNKKATSKKIPRPSPRGSDMGDDSGEENSDSDWGNTSKSGAKSKKKAVSRPKKRRRKDSESSASDQEMDDYPRVSLRNLGKSKQTYRDEQELDEDAEAYERELKEKQRRKPEDDDEEKIEAVVDYRMPREKELQDQLAQAPDGALTDEYMAQFRKDEQEAMSIENFNPEEGEFQIKWMNKSQRANTWHKLHELVSVKGYIKVKNFLKKIEDLQEYLAGGEAMPEEREELLSNREQHRALLKEFLKIDRVIAERSSPTRHGQVEYLVKWCELPYSECTWEPMNTLTSEEDMRAIDLFLLREQTGGGRASSGDKRLNPFMNYEKRKPYRKMHQQPKWLHGEGRTLRDYQLAGLNWLAYRWVNCHNVILADEMGLGKTLQTISFLGWLKQEKHVSWPFLVVVPLSTIAAWQREFARWLPEFNVICYVGDAKSRDMIRKYELYRERGSGVDAIRFTVLLTTPELILADAAEFAGIRWAMLVVDEAHRLKNEQSALSNTLASLTTANRLLITGTPLQNSIRELWALLHFLHPNLYADGDEFERKYSFNALKNPEAISALHDELQPLILRRQKGDVEKSLPKKTYSVLRVGMTSTQQKYYRWILTRNFAKINAGVNNSVRYGGGLSTLLNIVMELKKCCNHPYLFAGAEAEHTQSSNASAGELSLLIKASGKLILLDKLLLRLKEKGHRVLIFSQMVIMLDILQDYCRLRGFQCQRLDGSMPNDLRQRAVDHFNAPDSKDFVFLLSTRAGGLGINLATADTVIIFDSDWNPQNDLQAESRAHRIGQTKDVRVFRLLTRQSVEEDILERAKRKRVLEHLVIHGVEGGGEPQAGKNSFKKDELSAILRFGAEELFKSGDMMALDDTKLDANKDEQVAVVTGNRTHQVTDVTDIDALLTEPTNEETEDGHIAESTGDSLLNAFKWTDFSFEEEEERMREEEENRQREEQERKAKIAAQTAAELQAKEAKRKQIAEAIAAQEAIEKEKAAQEADADFWKRVIPEEEQENAIATELYIGRRQRKETKKFVIEDVTVKGGASKKRAHGSSNALVAAGEEPAPIKKKDLRALMKSFRKFGSVTRIKEVLEDCELSEVFTEEDAKELMEGAIRDAEAAVMYGKQASVDDTAAGTAHVPGLTSPGAENKPISSNEPHADADGDSMEIRQEDSAAEVKAENVPMNMDVVKNEEDGEKPAVAQPNAVKKALPTFEFAGEKINAEEFLRRNEELKLIARKVEEAGHPKNFRVRNNLLRGTQYQVDWTSASDSSLLVGIYKYGFGNYEKMKSDLDLGLEKLIYLGADDSSAVSGAPDAQKLNRRATALLRALVKAEEDHARREKKRLEAKSAKQEEAKSKKSKKSKKKTSKPVQQVSAKANDVAAKSSQFNYKKLAALQPGAIDELMKMSNPKFQIESKHRVNRTKHCLNVLGGCIESHVTDPEERVQLWAKVAKACRTSKTGETLQALYHRLLTKSKDKKGEDGSAAKKNENAPAE